MAESTAPRSQLPMPIAKMGPWFFWARPDAVGLSAEDAKAIRDGTASPVQNARAASLAEAARTALHLAPVGEIVRRPS